MYSFINKEDIYNLIISRTPMAVSRALNLCLKKRRISITKEQLSILVILWKEDGYSQQFLAEKTHRDKPGVTRLLDSLERQKLVTRRVHPFDRRTNLIFLTEEGKRLEQIVTESMRETVEMATKGISEEDAKTLKRILGVIFKNLQ